LAREKGWLVAWDEKQLYVFNTAGKSQGQRRMPAAIGCGCWADDGSALAAVGSHGEVWWLAPDLTLRWERHLPGRAVTSAIDSFGQYLAVADDRCGLTIFDRHARMVCQMECPRPLRHLAFVPTAIYLVASAEFGLVGCLDCKGHWAWRDPLVLNVGSLAAAGTGEQIYLACFSEGLQRYTLTGSKMEAISTVEPWGLVSVSFDGRAILAGGLSQRLHLLDGAGKSLLTIPLDAPPTALVLGPLGDQAFVALSDGRLLGIDLTAAAR